MFSHEAFLCPPANGRHCKADEFSLLTVAGPVTKYELFTATFQAKVVGLGVR